MPITFTDGTITTSASEQTIFDLTANEHFASLIFLHNMASGDTFVIKVYVKDQNAGSMRQYDSQTFTNAQTSPALYIPFITTKQYKVTIQRTAGTDRAVTWQSIEVS